MYYPLIHCIDLYSFVIILLLLGVMLMGLFDRLGDLGLLVWRFCGGWTGGIGGGGGGWLCGGLLALSFCYNNYILSLCTYSYLNIQ